MSRRFPRILLCLALCFLLFAPRSALSEQTFTYVIQPAYDRAYDFSEGVARVQSGDFFTFIDASGKSVLSQQFKGLTRLSEGLAGASIDGVHWGVIDSKGKFVIEPKFARIAVDGFSSGAAAFFKGSRWGYIDSKGNVLVEPQFQFAGPFDGEFAPVAVAGKFTFIDRTGKPAFPAQEKYEYASNFKDGVAVVVLDKRVSFIDREGKTVLSVQGLGGFPFNEGLAPVMADYGSCGFIDPKGAFVIPAQFPMAWSFSEGLAAFNDAKTNLWGYIDRSGKTVIPPTFEMAYSFMKVSGDKLLAPVKEPNKKWGFITVLK